MSSFANLKTSVVQKCPVSNRNGSNFELQTVNLEMNQIKKLRQSGFALFTKKKMCGKLTLAIENTCFSVALGTIDTFTCLLYPNNMVNDIDHIVSLYKSYNVAAEQINHFYHQHTKSPSKRNILFGNIIMVKSFRETTIDSRPHLRILNNKGIPHHLELKCAKKSMNSRSEKGVFTI